MQQLTLIEQFDPLVAKALVVHGEDWRFLAHAARILAVVPHYGELNGETFTRAPRQNRLGGQWLTYTEQDRLQALKSLF